MCCSPWPQKESDMTEHLNSAQLNIGLFFANKAQRKEPIKHFCIVLN